MSRRLFSLSQSGFPRSFNLNSPKIFYRQLHIDRQVRPTFRSSIAPLLLKQQNGLNLKLISLSRPSARSLTDKAPPTKKPRGRIFSFISKSIFYLGIFGAGSALLIVGFFLYDASTYKEAPSIESVPVSSLALTPRVGGPKNLPIVEHFVDDDDSESKKCAKHKPKLVILGTGWASVALLKTLKPEDWHVTVISPSNQFLFTPMLPSATVGTLELRSLVEPIRTIVTRVHGHFLKCMAVDVEFSEKLVEVEAVDSSTGNKQSFYLPYDKLVIASGIY
jgi:NADH dehydrogenase